MHAIILNSPLYKIPSWLYANLGEKFKLIEKELQNAVFYCFILWVSSPSEREEIATRWLAGDTEFYIHFAHARHIEPIAILTASLIEFEHPVLTPDGKPFGGSLLSLISEILQIEIENAITAGLDTAGKFASYPQISCKPVDNSLKTVDKSVDNSADNLSQTVDKLRVTTRVY